MKDRDLEAYCDAIEREFFRLKGRSGMLSPEDFSRVRAWHGADVPLSAVIEGIRLAFEDRVSGRDLGIEEVNSLGYCESFVAEAVARRGGKLS